MSFLPLKRIAGPLPARRGLVSGLETQARKSGRALTALESNLAQNVGVARPGEVRILSVPEIPPPAHPRVKQLTQQVGLLTADTGSLTAAYGVIARLDCANSPRLLAHEFVHVAQHEQLGREGFIQEYIQQIAAHGYQNTPFELEVEAEAVKACPQCRNCAVVALLVKKRVPNDGKPAR